MKEIRNYQRTLHHIKTI